jgi:predicted AlkP superfamily phosphohydrolase/phosphomutase
MKRKNLLLLIPVLIAATAVAVYFLHFRKHDRAEIRPRATKQKVYLIGLDGASWNLIKGPLKEGKLPNFHKLIQNGTSGPLKSFVPTKSPILWTSIATGKSQLKHGIGNFTAEKDGKMVPVSGNQRITKAFWNILSDYGISVGVVNWWVTWPPEQVKGFMVSDRYRNGSKKLAKTSLTYPSELIDELPKVGMSNERYMEDRHKFGMPEELYPPKADSKNIEMLAGNYKSYWSQDRAVREACRRLLRKNNVDVFAVVYRIIDVSSHLFWTYIDIDLIDQMRAKLAKGTLTQADIDRMDAEFTKVIGPIYMYADHILGDFIRSADANTNFIICSDHGFKFEEGRYGHSSMKEPPDGVIILTGPAFRKNAKITGATLLDITPTLLYLEGLPVARDMDGKILFSAFKPEFLRANKPTLVASHDKGVRQKGEPASSEMDDEILQDLRSLGYIQ